MNWNAIHLQEARREYGAPPCYPSHMDGIIEEAKLSTEADLLHKNRRNGHMLLNLVESLQEEEDKLHETMAPHLKRLYEGKRFLLLKRLLHMAADAHPTLATVRGLVVNIVSKLVSGFPTIGNIEPTGFWTALTADKIQAQLQREQEALSRNKKPPTKHWASEQDILEMDKQMQDMVASGRWLHISQDDLTSAGASIAFPVHKYDKIRRCIDFRHQSDLMTTSERMRLHGSRVAMHVATRCISGKRKPPHLFRFKNDIQAEITQERDLLKIVEENEAARAQSDNVFDADPYENWHGDSYSFIPVSQKRDLEQFYYQCGVKNPLANAIWFPIPFTSTPSRRTKRKWNLVASACSLFGSLSSVHDCVAVSESLMAVINLVFSVRSGDLLYRRHPLFFSASISGLGWCSDRPGSRLARMGAVALQARAPFTNAKDVSCLGYRLYD
ncbi:unnamed protein product [Amoebophrya sp. A25]|nr:unnamed protein product [Amoebophrya sp. A25]|eukprot:GSA25T00002642001.1